MDQSCFYDAHAHAISISHPNILDVVDRFPFFGGKNRELFIKSLPPLSAPDVKTEILLDENNRVQVIKEKDSAEESILKKGARENIKNLLCVIQGNCDEILDAALRDLTGSIPKAGSKKPFLSKNGFDIAGKHYDKFVFISLTMDFIHSKYDNPNSSYFNFVHSRDIMGQCEDLFQGIKFIRQKYSDYPVEIYPFLGVNPCVEGKEKMDLWMKKYFGDYSGKHSRLFQTYDSLSDDRITFEDMGSDFFAGIKLYPPLGFDPWPENKDDQSFLSDFYEKCEEKQIPITVHCSKSGGWRTLSEKQMKTFTDPKRWTTVLKLFPKLRVNFAHFGEGNWVRKHQIFMPWSWQNDILELMQKYDNVYTDCAFNGVFDKTYKGYQRIFKKFEVLQKKMLFGTDYLVNLAKIENYHRYFEYLEDGNFDWKDEIGSKNPEKFLFPGGR